MKKPAASPIKIRPLQTKNPEKTWGAKPTPKPTHQKFGAKPNRPTSGPTSGPRPFAAKSFPPKPHSIKPNPVKITSSVKPNIKPAIKPMDKVTTQPTAKSTVQSMPKPAANKIKPNEHHDVTHPTLGLEAATVSEGMASAVTGSFDEFNFSPEMKRAILELGYTAPTPIQLQTLPILLRGSTDFLGLASTGTGKTAAFGIPLLEKMDPHAKGVQALILCPTRELAKQVTEQINLLARYKKTKAIAIYGGSDYGGQLRALKEGVSIVVGTPGRIIDHLERGTLNLNHLQTVILDEADEMISMGFKEEIELILEKVNQEVKHQTWLFSATMSREVRKIADQFLENPEQIHINKTEGVASGVKQFYYQVHEYDKPEVIQKLIDQVPGFYGLIFCQTKMLVTDLTQILKNGGYSVDCLHGDMEQPARERTMKAFKAKNCTILVCTDVASRGLDVKDLTHVINYSLPRELDLYVHRIGRTGRGGKEGLALSLVTPSHMGLVRRIEQTTRSTMTKATLPTDQELLQIKIGKALEKFADDTRSSSLSIDQIKTAVGASAWKKAIQTMDKEEIVARFLAQGMAPRAKPADSTPAGFRDNGAREDRGFRGGDRGGDRGGYQGRRERTPFHGGGRDERPRPSGNREGSREGNRESKFRGRR